MYHFVGIKGAGMSSLACIMNDLGYEVQGSDYDKHFFTEESLKKRNIKMFPFDANNVKKDMIIVQGNTFNNDHEEIKKANELGLKIYSYQEMLGRLTQKFTSICIAGCHGKTTTTSMMAHVLNSLIGCNYLIGDGTGYANKENDYFILESCEYKRHFLEYNPDYAIITNIELDHVDYFKNIDDVISAYQEFANKAEKMVIACGDDPYTHSLEINPPIFFYGLDEDNDIRAINVEYSSLGIKFDVEVEENYYGSFDLPIYGKHMLLNALAVIGVCYYERLEAREVSKIFKTYKGAKRRFTEIVVDDTVLIDDYAHHPTEAKALIKATKQKYSDKDIIIVFQPHTFSRTKEFADDLIKVFELANHSYILDIHPAREKQEDFENVTSDIIISKLSNSDHIGMNDSDKLLKHKGSVILFMSPNDLSELENSLIEKLKNA